MAEGARPIPLRILVVDDEQSIRVTLALCLEADGHEVTTVGTPTDALAAVSRIAFDLVYLDLRLGVDNGLDLIPRIRAEAPWSKIIIITAYASVDTAVEAIKRGAADYLPKPFTPAQVALLTSKTAEQSSIERQFEALKASIGDNDPDLEFMTADPAMERALDLARRVAPSNATILIQGEVGTGKEKLARAIHFWSSRAQSPFVSASCLPGQSLEEELFGISTADAPDASAAQRGRIAFSEGGTLLLKEICQMPPVLQARLVRLLQDKEYERRNDFTPRRADVRVIVTSTQDLHDAAERGVIGRDLLLAVDVVSITIPPLRQRRQDILLLANCYLAHFSRRHQRGPVAFSADAEEALLKHDYPGNARELRNLVERAVLICRGEHIELVHLPANLLNGPGVHSIGDLVTLETLTDLHIRRVLATTHSFESAASILGINSITLWRRRKKYGI